MHLFPLAFEGFKIVGALYLGWIGFELLRAGWQRRTQSESRAGSITINSETLSTPMPAAPAPEPAPAPANAATNPAVLTSSARRAPLHEDPFLRALGLSLTNPKAILFFLAFFTQFVSPTAGSVALAYFVLGLVVQVVSLSYLWMLIVAGHRLARQFEEHPRWAGAGLMLVGAFFVGFALRLVN
jgi:leucine efflux protein